jgi:hypothetical protein
MDKLASAFMSTAAGSTRPGRAKSAAHVLAVTLRSQRLERGLNASASLQPCLPGSLCAVRATVDRGLLPEFSRPDVLDVVLVLLGPSFQFLSCHIVQHQKPLGQAGSNFDQELEPGAFCRIEVRWRRTAGKPHWIPKPDLIPSLNLPVDASPQLTHCHQTAHKCHDLQTPNSLTT